MNEDIVLFLQKAEKDEALVAKLSAIRNPDEAYALATTVQGGFTKEEFIAAMDEIRKEELSDADLMSLAGGGKTDDVLDSILISTSVSSAASASAALAI
ncbi:MAG: Nif11-like leader peptide family natural product precursor [Clostridia bacterium]|nr:Nif11-like leader peptide family natural product precursor [Clostridia bacterium]